MTSLDKIKKYLQLNFNTNDLIFNLDFSLLTFNDLVSSAPSPNIKKIMLYKYSIASGFLHFKGTQ